MAAAVLVGLNHVAEQRISGSPQAAWPQPPPVGACVNLGSDAGSGSGDGAVEVPCSGPHDAEVTKSYSPLDPALADSPTASIGPACADASRSFLGYGASGVSPPFARPGDSGADGGWFRNGDVGGSDDPLVPLDLSYSTSPVVAPQSERVGDRGWQICVIQPEPAVRYLGSVHGATRSDAPDAYRTCWGPGGASDPVACTGPHTYEVFGAAAGGVSVPLVVSPLAESNAGAALGAGDGSVGDGASADAETGAASEQRAAELAAQQQRVWEEVLAQTDRIPLAQALAEDMQRAVDAGQPAQSALIGQVDQATLALAGQLLARCQRLGEHCRTMAADVVGADDPTFGDTLTAQIRPGKPGGTAVTPPPGAQVLIGGQADENDSPTGYTVTMSTGIEYCVIAAPDNRQLTRSLAGWGDQLLPLTGG